jgi:WD40 repeat protein
MSPEQAEAARRPVDHRTDVYSLGATLYELVTRRAAFNGDTPVDVLLQVLEREPVRPRRLEPALPRDLETIVLKAMAKRPADRYPTAAALADDLRRFLRTEPVQARRIGMVGRLGRWCRRNPAVAALTATAALLLVAVAAVATVGYLETSTALAREQEAREREAEVRALAQAAQRQAEGERDRAEVAREKARDHLLVSLQGQAQAMRLSNQLGRRWETLKVVREAERLRSQPRKGPPAARLPTQADLRSEAVNALLWLDARLVREVAAERVGSSLPRALSPDGRWTLDFSHAANANKIGVRLFDPARGTEETRWEVSSKEELDRLIGSSMCLDPAGKLLATAGGVTGQPPQVTLFEARSGRLLRTLPWPDGPDAAAKRPTPWPLESLTFNPDGNFLVGHSTQPVEGRHRLVNYLWDLRPGGPARRLAQVDLDQPGVRPVFNAAGTRLAFQDGPTRLVVWDVGRQQPAHTVRLSATIRGVPAFRPDDTYLVVPCGTSENETGSLRFWDLQRETEVVWPLQTGGGLTHAVPAFRPDGQRLALINVQGQVTLYNMTGPTPILEVERALQDFVLRPSLFWQADGRMLLTAREFGPVRSWELVGDTPYSWLESGRPRAWALGAAALSGPAAGFPAGAPWGALAASGRGDWPGPFGAAVGFAFSPDGKWLAVASETRVHLVRRATGEVERAFPCACLRLVFRADSRQLAAFGMNMVRAWEVPTGREVARLGAAELTDNAFGEAFNARYLALVRPSTAAPAAAMFPWAGFTAQGRCLALRQSATSGVWDVLAGREVYQITMAPEHCYLSPQGQLFGASVGPAVVGWRPPDLPWPAAVGEPAVWALHVDPAFPDGVMTTNGDGTWLAMNLADQMAIRMGGFLRVGGNSGNPRVALWHLRTETRTVLTHTLPGTLVLPGTATPAPPATPGKPSPNSGWWAWSGSRTETVTVQNQPSSKNAAPAPGGGSQTVTLTVKVEKERELRVSAPPLTHAFSRDARLLALALGDGSVQVWDAERGEELFHWTPHTPPLSNVCLAFTPDGETLAGCDGRSNYLWTLNLPQLRRELAEVGLDW